MDALWGPESKSDQAADSEPLKGLGRQFWTRDSDVMFCHFRFPRTTHSPSSARAHAGSEQRRSGPFTHFGSHRKFPGDQISQCVTYMGARPVRFVQIGQQIAMWVRSPRYLLKVLDEMFTVLIDEESMLTGVIPQLGIHAVHPILHGRIRAPYMDRNAESIGITDKELLYNLPIRARS